MSDNKAGWIALAAGAVAAGMIVYNSMKGKKSKKNQTPEAARKETEEEQKHVETLQEELENNFFMDPTKSAKENQDIITKWMNDQIDTILGQYFDAKLEVKNLVIKMEDFERVMLIINCRQTVLSHEMKIELDASRIQMIKDKGLDSLDYIKQLVQDTREVCNLQADAATEVCNLLDIREDVVVESQEKHFGSGEADSVDVVYVRKILDLFLYHPFVNSKTKERAEALTIAQAILDKASERIVKADTFGLFDNAVEYLICFNSLCVDIAQVDHDLSEADYQHLIDQHDLSCDKALQTFYIRVTDGLLAQLCSEGPDPEEEKNAEEEAKAVQVQTLQRKKTEKEAIVKFLADQEEEKKKAKAEKAAAQQEDSKPQDDSTKLDVPADQALQLVTEPAAASPGKDMNTSDAASVVTDATMVADQMQGEISQDGIARQVTEE